jgi:hypothetical protein
MKSQLSDQNIEVLFRSFGSIFAFQQGNPADAAVAAESMLAYGLSKQDFSMLEEHIAYTQLTVDNEKMRAFSMNTKQVPNPIHDTPADQMALHALEKAQEIERKIAEQNNKRQKKLWQDIDVKLQQLDKKLATIPLTAEEDDDFIDLFYED